MQQTTHPSILKCWITTGKGLLKLFILTCVWKVCRGINKTSDHSRCITSCFSVTCLRKTSQTCQNISQGGKKKSQLQTDVSHSLWVVKISSSLLWAGPRQSARETRQRKPINEVHLHLTAHLCFSKEPLWEAETDPPAHINTTTSR